MTDERIPCNLCEAQKPILFLISSGPMFDFIEDTHAKCEHVGFYLCMECHKKLTIKLEEFKLV